MPINPTYPGVYIEELENPVKTIVGVSTSVTAFVGRALKGPVNDATIIHNFGEFDSIFGGLWKESTMSYAVYQYFLNGGADAVIVRVVSSDAKKVKFENSVEPGIKFEAQNEGEWAKTLMVTTDQNVDDDAPDKDLLFNVRVKEKVADTGDPKKDFVELETFLNVSFGEDHRRYVNKLLEEESDLIRISTNALTARPAALNFDVVADPSNMDGSAQVDNDLKGDPAEKKGIFALDKADIFNLLCIPSPNKDGTDTPGLYNLGSTKKPRDTARKSARCW